MGSLAEPLLVLVDDEQTDRVLATSALREARFSGEIMELETGPALLEFLSAHPERSRPVVVLLDFNLPGMNGIDVLTELERRADSPSVPVVLITSSHAQSLRSMAKARHAVCTITKPDTYPDFVQVFSQLRGSLIQQGLLGEASWPQGPAAGRGAEGPHRGV